MIGCEVILGRPKLKPNTLDNVVLMDLPKERTSFDVLNRLKELGVGIISPHPIAGATPLITLSQAKTSLPIVVLVGQEEPKEWELLLQLKPTLLIFAPKQDALHEGRRFFEWLQSHNLHMPVILHLRHPHSYEESVIQAAAEYGALLTDGYGEGIWIDAPLTLEARRTLSFNILQAARMRSSKTDFISCPSCGRTLFDLQDVTKRIRSRTSHLPGVKIAIMGCIVNGPGEMADADFGYVGSKPGKIDLYVGKTCVERDIDFSLADDRLIALIKSHDRWIEPS
jgi:(E)-4-hydroxy-3-methylbut-2-enyl-diphosphate synthase